MLRGNKLFLICLCLTRNGCARILRLASSVVIQSVLIVRVKHTKESEITGDRHCSSVVTTTTARKSLVNATLIFEELLSSLTRPSLWIWIIITVISLQTFQHAESAWEIQASRREWLRRRRHPRGHEHDTRRVWKVYSAILRWCQRYLLQWDQAFQSDQQEQLQATGDGRGEEHRETKLFTRDRVLQVLQATTAAAISRC